jgi:predicted Zn-dependent protease
MKDYLLILAYLTAFCLKAQINVGLTATTSETLRPKDANGYTNPKNTIEVNENIRVLSIQNQSGLIRYMISHNGEEQFLTALDISKLRFLNDGEVSSQWKYLNLIYGAYENAAKNGGQYELRKGLENEALQFQYSFLKNDYIFHDSYLENYLQSIVNQLFSPEFLVNKRQGELMVKVLDDNVPNAYMTANGTMYIHTGLLSVLQNEEELKAVILHELAHFILDHSVVNYNKLKKDEARLAFWSGVATSIAAISEVYMASNHDVYFGGSLTYAVALGSIIRSENLLEKLGNTYSLEQEMEADICANSLLPFYNVNPKALLSAFNRIKNYHINNGDFGAIEEWGTHPSLQYRINQIEKSAYTLPEETSYQRKVALAVIQTAYLEFYYNHFTSCITMLNRNIQNGCADERDYVLAAMALSRVSDYAFADSLSLQYLVTAEKLNVNPTAEIYKQKALTLLRMRRAEEAIEEVKRYIEVIEDAEEQAWGRNLILRAPLITQ